MAKKLTLKQVRARYAKVQTFIDGVIDTDRYEERNRGFIEYKPANTSDTALVCVTGRGATPANPDGGMHMTAADAASRGFPAIIVSAHAWSRRQARNWLKKRDENRIVIMGHSHGGDHAATLAAEFWRATERQVDLLITVDPLDSPKPLPLTRIPDRRSVERHINYYQRYRHPFRPWYGGSMTQADLNTDVTWWVSWTRSLKAGEIRAGINHTTIDEDLFLHGVLSQEQ